MSSMAAMEQATLGQYFTTRRKGLEGIHPAKRRKVDVTETESDVAVRRSKRSKRQVASSTAKITRATKAAKSNAKKSLNEESGQSSYTLGIKAASETTSLFDDHAFAEAFIGKLTDAQRKRKMASSTQIEDTVPRDSSAVETSQAQKNKGEMESKPKNRRQTARSSKSTKQAENREHSKILNATEQVVSSSHSKDKSLCDQPPCKPVAPVEKEISASPSKTPPVVRRIGGGVKANPWIAEQAKMVLSRGRAAVNICQKGRSKEDKQTTASKDTGSGEIMKKKNNNLSRSHGSPIMFDLY